MQMILARLRGKFFSISCAIVSIFMQCRPKSNEDIYIGVMGVTGAGKSSFIQQCVPSAENIVGNGYDSCESSKAGSAEGTERN